MKKKFLAFLLACILLAALFTLFIGCPNFMQGNDVKNVISTEVAEANAPEISVRIQPLSSEMGTTTPNGVITEKVGIPFTISTAANPEYAFVGWDSPVEAITFGDIEAAETTVVASRAQNEEILIVSNFDARPKVLTHEPFSQDGVLMNQKVTIVFSEAVEPSTINYENISVVAKRRNTTDDPISMTDRLKDPLVSGSNVELQFEGTNTYDAQNYVIVSLSKAITDLDGHQMKEDFSWSFITGSSTDLSIPAINHYYLILDVDNDNESADPDDIKYDDPTTLLITDYESFRIKVDASDDVSVETIHISESAMNDSGDTVLATADLWRSDYYGINYEYVFNLRTSGDGRKRLRITVLDPPLQESAYEDISISLDTTAPTISGLVLNGGNQYVATETTIPISVTVTDPGYSTGIGSGVSQYAVNFNPAEPSEGGGFEDWKAYSDPLTEVALPDPGTEGEKTLYFHARDPLGNWRYATTTVNVDNTPPGFVDVSAPGDGTYRAGETITFDVDLNETGLNVAADLSVLDSDFNTDQIFVDDGDGTYSFTTPALDLGGNMQEGTAITIPITANDPAGNSTDDNSLNLLLDKTPPTISIGVSNPQAIQNGQTVDYDVTYGGYSAITLDSGDITVKDSGGTPVTDPAVTNVTTSGDTRTVTLTATGAADGNYYIDIAAGTANDAAGNSSFAASASSNQFTIDNVPPTISLSTPSSTLIKGGGTVDYDVTYGGYSAITLDSGDITVKDSGGTPVTDPAVTNVTTSGDTRTVTLTATGAADGNYYIDIAAGTANDAAGNEASDASASTSQFSVTSAGGNITSGTGRGESLLRKNPPAVSGDDSTDVLVEKKQNRRSSVYNYNWNAPEHTKQEESNPSDLEVWEKDTFGRPNTTKPLSLGKSEEKNKLKNLKGVSSAGSGGLEQPDFTSFVLTEEPIRKRSSGGLVASSSMCRLNEKAQDTIRHSILTSSRPTGDEMPDTKEEPDYSETEAGTAFLSHPSDSTGAYSLYALKKSDPEAQWNTTLYSSRKSDRKEFLRGDGSPTSVPRDKNPKKDNPQSLPEADIFITHAQRAEYKAKRFDLEGNVDGAVV